MTRPPRCFWALPAAVASGFVLGLHVRSPSADPAAVPRLAPVVATRVGESAPPAPTLPSAPGAAVPEATAWDLDGGPYRPLAGSAWSDTLPAAPVVVGEGLSTGEPPGFPEAGRDAQSVGPGPAQALGREEALARPLVASVRTGGRVVFYSAWDAPAERASLVGEWARVGACGDVVRLAYEQALPGLGGVRGAGELRDAPPWDLALVVARQHCAAASARWRHSRPPRPGERDELAPLLGGEPAVEVVSERAVTYAGSRSQAVAAGRVGPRLVARWSTAAPERSTIRFLGVWEGEGMWAAVETGGRVVRLWRVGPQ